uniref:Peptide methionine sulfoxide reductase MsrA n=1 Tax=Desulfobacca acetoxidans TaxID=60893 RepID=A0A7C3V8N2_9BACT
MAKKGFGPVGLLVIALVFAARAGAGLWAGKLGEERGIMEAAANLAVATFAGGCFWCMEADFEKVPGVAKVVSGYTGGSQENPTYDNYADSGHVEAVQVFYDPQKVTYRQLLDYFWRHIDPTDAGGQFVDRGPQYRSAIFYHDEEQKRAAEESKAALARSGRFKQPIVTPIIKFTRFYPAEGYHQDYYRTHAARYKFYRWNSGRDQFLREHWGKD